MSAGIWMVIIDEVWIVGRAQKVHLNEDSQDCKPVRLVCSILWRPILQEQGCKCKSRSNNLKFDVHFQLFQIKNGKFKPWCYSGQCVARRRTVFHQQCAHFRARRTSPSGRAFARPGEIFMSFGSPLEVNFTLNCPGMAPPVRLLPSAGSITSQDAPVFFTDSPEPWMDGI